MRRGITSIGEPGFWLWALVGVGLGFGISQIGVFTIPAGALVAVFLLRRPSMRHSAYGVPVGIGIPLLIVAYINREGPGTVCHTVSNGLECAHGLPDPKRWAAVGLAFIVAGVLSQVFAAGPRAA